MRSIVYPAARKDTASARARLPAPTIAIRGFLGHLTGMSGRIAESVLEASAEENRRASLDWTAEGGCPHMSISRLGCLYRRIFQTGPLLG
jgi:hypothetical protein